MGQVLPVVRLLSTEPWPDRLPWVVDAGWHKRSQRLGCTPLLVIALWVALGSPGSFPPFGSSMTLISVMGLAMSMVDRTACSAWPNGTMLLVWMLWTFQCSCPAVLPMVFDCGPPMRYFKAPLGERYSRSGDSCPPCHFLAWDTVESASNVWSDFCCSTHEGLQLDTDLFPSCFWLGHGEDIVERDLTAGATIWIVG